jgi:hypothetical protein
MSLVSLTRQVNHCSKQVLKLSVRKKEKGSISGEIYGDQKIVRQMCTSGPYADFIDDTGNNSVWQLMLSYPTSIG